MLKLGSRHIVHIGGRGHANPAIGIHKECSYSSIHEETESMRNIQRTHRSEVNETGQGLKPPG